MTGGDNNIYQQQNPGHVPGGKPDEVSDGTKLKVGLSFLETLLQWAIAKFKWR